MPKITQSFNVEQEPELVWHLFQDIPRLATCMPGLEYGGEIIEEDGTACHRGTARVKLGPVSATFEGKALILSINENERYAHIEGKGVDKRGGSRASASITYNIQDIGNATVVIIEADIKLSGALAQIGRTGIVQDVATQITEQFADNLRKTLATETSAKSKDKITAPRVKELRGDTLLLKIIWQRIKSYLGWKS